MALEDLTGTNKYLANLVITNPLAADDRREGDDHIRGIKNVLLNTFGALSAPASGTYVAKAGDTMTGALKVADGTVAAPGLAFASEAGLGWYRPSAGNVYMSKGGATTFSFGTSASNSTLGINPPSPGTAAINMSSGGATTYNLMQLAAAATGYGISEQLGGTATAKPLTLSFPAGVATSANLIAGTSVVSYNATGPGFFSDASFNYVGFPGDTSWSWKFYKSSAQVDWFGAGQQRFSFLADGTAYKAAAGGSWLNYSDARIKQNIADYTTGLAAVLALRPRTFNWHADTGRDASQQHAGLIAQETETVMPDIVSVAPETIGTDIKNRPDDLRVIDVSNVTWALVNSVKELSTKLDAALARIAVLEGAAPLNLTGATGAAV